MVGKCYCTKKFGFSQNKEWIVLLYIMETVDNQKINKALNFITYTTQVQVVLINTHPFVYSLHPTSRIH